MGYSSNFGVVISGSGLWIPEQSISNKELVESYNAYATKYNKKNGEAIALGELEEKYLSSERFIEKASGIKNRFVYSKKGILDIEKMTPVISERTENQLSHQAQIGINAAKKAIKSAKKTNTDIDAVIVACAYTQRAYPAISIEIQEALGIDGFAFDMLGACSAATFGLHRAYDAITSGSAKCVLIINPELVTPQVDYCNRDTHFIFGDVGAAVIIESAETCTSKNNFEILGTKAMTQFSSNIRSNFGHITRATGADPYGADKLFHQAGRIVFEEVSPIAAEHIKNHLTEHSIKPGEVKRFWLHQANINMNNIVIKKLLGKEADKSLAPVILDTFGNTASAGSILAFHLNSSDMVNGDIGVICSFGAGYSVGSLLLRKN